MTSGYFGVLAIFLFSAVITGAMIFLTSVLGPKRGTREKDTPYETGKDPFSLPGTKRVPVHFYVIAMIFIIFDVELAFLFPWAVIFRHLGWLGLLEISVFVFFIFLAYLYAWKNRALDAE